MTAVLRFSSPYGVLDDPLGDFLAVCLRYNAQVLRVVLRGQCKLPSLHEYAISNDDVDLY